MVGETTVTKTYKKKWKIPSMWYTRGFSLSDSIEKFCHSTYFFESMQLYAFASPLPSRSPLFVIGSDTLQTIYMCIMNRILYAIVNFQALTNFKKYICIFHAFLATLCICDSIATPCDSMTFFWDSMRLHSFFCDSIKSEKPLGDICYSMYLGLLSTNLVNLVSVLGYHDTIFFLPQKTIKKSCFVGFFLTICFRIIGARVILTVDLYSACENTSETMCCM